MVFKCKICGGNLDVKDTKKIIECEYCGTKQTLPKLESDKITNLYDRANHFRRNNEYDKAEAIYEMILNEDPEDPEAYWSLILCKYGVEYVLDPKTSIYIPTCNRAQNASIFADEDYKKALQYASDEAKELYKIEAEKINNIQKGILEISNKEEPFDIFICYKETDENGQRTQDSVIAQDIYYELKKEGYRVFFSRITLENKIGQSYEPYIYAALNSAKVMLVIGTKKEYFEATWVKNEWSRYLTLIKNGEQKTIIPCFKGMSAYDIPEEFAYLQAQDMSKLGFAQDLMHGIRKIINPEQKAKEVTKKKSNVPAFIAVFIVVLIVILGFMLINKKDVQNEAPKVINETKNEKEILRESIVANGGYTFNMKAKDLADEIMKEVAKSEYADSIKLETLESDYDSTEYLAIGWISEAHDDYGEPLGYKETIGIEIYSIEDYVINVYCLPARYGSGEMQLLNVPVNLFKQAKKILGSETEEWKELEKSGTIIETTYDEQGYETGDEEFWAGMSKVLSIVRK